MTLCPRGKSMLGLGVVLGLLLAARGARAEEVRPRVVVLDVTVGGDAPRELKKSLVASLGGGLYAAGWTVVPPEKLKEALGTAPELANCTTPTCLETLAVMLGETRLFVRARITAAGAAYNIELELLTPTAGSGGAVARIEQGCEVCSLGELNAKLSDAAVALKQRAAEQASAADAVFRVTIKSEPPGASVTIDGVDTGTTMLSADLPAGRHEVTVRYGGYKPATRTIEVSRGGVNALEVALERAPPPPPPGRYRPYKGLSLAAIGLGVVAVGAGVYLLAIDGDGTCDSGGECPELNDTLLPGAVSTGVGAVLIGAGVYLFTRKRTRRDVGVALAPLPGGGSFSIAGRF